MLPPPRRFRLSFPALSVLVLGLTVTILLFANARRIARDQVEFDLQQQVDQRFSAVRDGFKDSLEGLLSVNQLFAVNQSVTEAQFQAFTRPILERHPFMKAFSFQRQVNAAELPTYIQQTRQRRPAFFISEIIQGKQSPALEKQNYLVVDYISPLGGNAVVLGLDVSSNAIIMEATKIAASTGQPVATDMFKLAQESESQNGFVVTMPVFNHEQSNQPEQFPDILGFTTTVFRSTDLVTKALSTHLLLSTPGFDLTIYVGDKMDSAHTVFQHSETKEKPDFLSTMFHHMIMEQPRSINRSFDAAGKTWHIIATAEPDFFEAHPSSALEVLLVGCMLSLLLAYYIQTQSNRSRYIDMLISSRTTELQAANDMLKQDNAARKRAEQALRLRERAIKASTNAVVITSAEAPNFSIEYVNPAFEKITGYTEEDVIGRNCSLLWGNDTDQDGIREIVACAREEREGHLIMRNYRKDGSLFWCEIYISPVRNDQGKVEHFVAIQYDITETKAYQDKLEILANRDALTGLPNRNLVRTRMEHAITRAENLDRHFSVVHIDIDHFKYINDTMGHRVGDQLLKQIAARLQTIIHENDTLARVGADEFILILENADATVPLTELVRNMLDIISEPLEEDGHEFFLTGSIGIATYPQDGADPEILIKHADIAMYRAKEMGRNNSQIFTADMNQRALERMQIEGDLRNALDRREFILHYQPQVDLHTGKIVGMEALIRWKHRDLGMVSPARFIGVAEETGLIVPIGEWVLRTACEQNMAWQQAGFQPLRIAVNLSARQFGQKDLVQSIATILKETGLDPDQLEIELTESMVMADVERAIGILRDLNDLGVKLSIDDFGTGYSSLSYLKRFPIDVLKIDQSFVRDITVDADDAAIAVAIISLALSLKLQVIAEGVETEAQLDFLRRNHCDQMQGYYFSRPVPATEFTEILRSGKSLSFSTE